ncbi:MAG: DUF4249 family protein [Chitinophagaceae bacterium]|nr:DUF4249 family protein [Chitinophagaceae bacterium]
MKKTKRIAQYILIGIIFFACEDLITIEVAKVERVLVVDAIVSNKDAVQVIKLLYTNPYFDNSESEGVSGATVRIIDSTNFQKIFTFQEGKTKGYYEWDPKKEGRTFGEIGKTYILQVAYNDKNYVSVSKMKRVPQVDSITFFVPPTNAFVSNKRWFSEIWLRDFPGKGDAYWIKGWKNNQFFNKPNEIVLAYDASNSRGAEIDGIYLIPPVRRSFNNAITSDSDSLFIKSPYKKGDTLYVEVYSITDETFFYLSNVKTQTNRAGGFGELFATSFANAQTNIFSATIENGSIKIIDDDPVVGFFNVSAVSNGMGILKEE